MTKFILYSLLFLLTAGTISAAVMSPHLVAKIKRETHNIEVFVVRESKATCYIAEGITTAISCVSEDNSWQR